MITLGLKNLLLDSGSGKNRKLLDVGKNSLTALQQSALIGYHAFSGNDYVSCFFRRGKKKGWKLIENSDDWLNVFSILGENKNVEDDVMQKWEQFVCLLNGRSRCSSVNQARREIFWDKLHKKNKIVDLSLLPPCQSSLKKHIKRANYVARMWRQSVNPVMDLPDPTQQGWNKDQQIEWVDEPYPNDVGELLFEKEDKKSNNDNEDADEDEEYDGDEDEDESDSDED